MKTDELDRLRKRIGKVNRRLLDLLNQRLLLVGRIRAVKIAQGLSFHDPRREAQMLRELAATNEGPLTKQQLERIYREIFQAALEHLEAGRTQQTKKKKAKRRRT